MSAPAARVLLLGGASQPAGHDCLVQARALGIDVVLADTAENLAKEPALREMAAETVELPYDDAARCVAFAAARQRETPFIGVYGFREFAVEAVAATAEALDLAGNPLEAVRRVRDKVACRDALRSYGFAQPQSRLCASLDDARSLVATTGDGPWVVKPPASMGSAGVGLVREVAELADAAAWARAATGASEGAPFVTETFQRGEEVSAEGVFVDGSPELLAVTAKTTTGAPHFVETGHAVPAPLAPADRARLGGTVGAALRALGLSWGVFHVEAWLLDDDVVLGEVHVRPGGDYIHVMTQYVTGVPLHGTVFAQMLGKVPDVGPAAGARAAAVRFLTPPPGVVGDVAGWDEVTADARLLAGKLTLAKGAVVPLLRSSADRSSFVVARGATHDEAVTAAEDLLARVRVDVVEGAA